MPHNSHEFSLKKLFAKGDQALHQWVDRVTDYTDLRIGDQHDAADAVEILLTALARTKKERDKAIKLITVLARERTEVRAAWEGRTGPTVSETTYRAVGLDPHCPRFLLQAARTAHRRRWHPDVHSSDRKKDAHRRFLECEAIFEKLFQERKL